MPDEEREHRRPQVEKRKATHNIVSIPFFADTAKNTGKKKIPDGQTCLPKSGSAFHGIRTFFGKMQKNGSPGGDRTHDQLLRRQL